MLQIHNPQSVYFHFLDFPSLINWNLFGTWSRVPRDWCLEFAPASYPVLIMGVCLFYYVLYLLICESQVLLLHSQYFFPKRKQSSSAAIIAVLFCISSVVFISDRSREEIISDSFSISIASRASRNVNPPFML